jgi:hypothetical protein
MTILQDELITRLPENNFNVSKTARKVGYKESSSKSGLLYEAIRRKLAKAYNPEAFKAKILKYENKFIKDGDNSNLMANLTLQAKILGLTKEQTLVQVNQIDVDSELIKRRSIVTNDVST